jgi:glycosyltransferase involved in cell wall biosynthesis
MMAARLPVVATRVGGIPEIVVEGETGLLVREKDSQSLAAAIISLLRDQLALRRMGERARRRAEQFHDVNVIAAKVEAAYRRALRAATAV